MHKQRMQTRQVSQELHQVQATRKPHQALFQVRFRALRVLLQERQVQFQEHLGLGQGIREVQAEVSNSLLLVRPKIHSRSSASRCRTVT